MNKIILAGYNLILDLIFPRRCIICGAYKQWICAECVKEIHLIRTDTCFYCGKISKQSKVCPKCKTRTQLKGIVSAISYESKEAKELVHNLKYLGIIEISELLGEYLVQKIRFSKFDPSGFVVVPVPSHKNRQSIRGYNQAELLARFFCLRLNLPGGLALEKIKDLNPQVSFNREQRIKNVLGSIICVDQEFIEDKKVLLIDDISTTGATLGECAKILKQYGAKEVWALVVARA